MFNLKCYNQKQKLEESDITAAAKLLSEINFRNGFVAGNIELLEDFHEILEFFIRVNKDAEEEMPPTEEDCIRLMKAQDFILHLPLIENQILKLRGKYDRNI